VLDLQKIILCAIYIPPNLCSNIKKNITEYLIIEIDHFSTLFKTNNIILCGDLNDYISNDIENNFNLTKVIKCSTTRSGSSIDQFIISDHLSNNYHAPITTAPIGNSYHLTIVIEPLIINCSTEEYVTFFDLRQTNIDSLCEDITTSNITNIFTENNIDNKCSIFYDSIHSCLENIPTTTVRMTKRDKPWITPLIKLIINRRWSAFRENNAVLYNYYK
jgi:hypothetical protein